MSRIIWAGMMDLDKLKISESNIRKTMSKDMLESLVLSIYHHGQVAPLIVNTKNEIIGGQRRYLAMKEAGLKEAFVVKKEYKSRDEEILDSLIDDQLFERVDSREISEALNQLYRKGKGLKLEEIALRLGKTPDWVSRIASVSLFPEEVEHALKSEEVPEEKKEIAHKIKDKLQSMSVRKANVVKRMLKKEPYKSDLYEQIKLIDRADRATLRQVEQWAKDMAGRRTAPPVDEKIDELLEREPTRKVVIEVPLRLWKEFLDVCHELRIDPRKARIDAIKEWVDRHRLSPKKST